AIGVFRDDGLAVLHTGDIEAAIGAGRSGGDLIVAAGAELVFRQKIALGIEFGEIGVGAALRGLMRADHAAGNGGLAIDRIGDGITRDRTPDIDIAAGIDTDRIGTVV